MASPFRVKYTHSVTTDRVRDAAMTGPLIVMSYRYVSMPPSKYREALCAWPVRGRGGACSVHSTTGVGTQDLQPRHARAQ